MEVASAVLGWVFCCRRVHVHTGLASECGVQYFVIGDLRCQCKLAFNTFLSSQLPCGVEGLPVGLSDPSLGSGWLKKNVNAGDGFVMAAQCTHLVGAADGLRGADHAVVKSEEATTRCKDTSLRGLTLSECWSCIVLARPPWGSLWAGSIGVRRHVETTRGVQVMTTFNTTGLVN